MIPLLQTVNFYQTQTDWRTMLIMAGAAGGVILFLIVFSRFSGGKKRGPKRYSRLAFRREALSKGLSLTQIHLLEHYIKIFNIHRPYQLLIYSSLLISTVKKASRQLENSKLNESVREDQKLQLYRVLQKVDASTRMSSSNHSTRRLRPGQEVTLAIVKRQEVHSVVTTNVQDLFTVKQPMSDPQFSSSQLRKHKKIIVVVYKQNEDKRISFEAKMQGIARINDVPNIVLKHTVHTTPSDSRLLSRRPLKCRCIYYPLNILEQKLKRKQARRTVVASQKGINGNMIDISPGGCSWESLKSQALGSLVKVKFQLPSSGELEAYGKVVNLETNTRQRVVFKVQFTRISAKCLNRISEYCYELTQN